MALRGYRDDYVQAVSDLCDMTRHLAAMQEEYVAAVNDGNGFEASEVRKRWQLYTDGIKRLLAEERACYDDYAGARRRLTT
jgi:hypothetical protein